MLEKSGSISGESNSVIFFRTPTSELQISGICSVALNIMGGYMRKSVGLKWRIKVQEMRAQYSAAGWMSTQCPKSCLLDSLLFDNITGQRQQFPSSITDSCWGARGWEWSSWRVPVQKLLLLKLTCDLADLYAHPNRKVYLSATHDRK